MDHIQSYDLGYFMENEVPENRYWVGPSFVPKRGKTIIGAFAKSGKTFAALQLAKDLAFGGYAFGHPALEIRETAKVLLLEGEVGLSGTHDRIKNIYKNSNWPSIRGQLQVVSREPKLKMDTYAGFGNITALVEKHQPNVLIIDPLANFLEGDDSNNQDIQKFMDNCNRLLEQYTHTDLSIVITAHCGKPPKDKKGVDFLDPYNIRGASRIYDAVDSVMMMNKVRKLQPGWVNEARITLRHTQPLDDFELMMNHWRVGAAWAYKEKEQEDN